MSYQEVHFLVCKVLETQLDGQWHDGAHSKEDMDDLRDQQLDLVPLTDMHFFLGANPDNCESVTENVLLREG